MKKQQEILPSTFVNRNLNLKGSVYLRSHYELNHEKWSPSERPKLLQYAVEKCGIAPHEADSIPSWAWRAIEKNMVGEELVLFIDVLTQNTLKIISLFSAVCVAEDVVYRYDDRSLEQDHKASVNRVVKQSVQICKVPIFLRLGDIDWDADLKPFNEKIVTLNYSEPELHLSLESYRKVMRKSKKSTKKESSYALKTQTICLTLKTLGKTENKN